MGLQKYRADRAYADMHGVVNWYTQWVGGPTLAKLENCPTPFGPRTVYVTGDADSAFSLPAACRFKGKDVRGFLTCYDNKWEFHPYTQSYWFPHVIRVD